MSEGNGRPFDEGLVALKEAVALDLLHLQELEAKTLRALPPRPPGSLHRQAAALHLKAALSELEQALAVRRRTSVRCSHLFSGGAA